MTKKFGFLKIDFQPSVKQAIMPCLLCLFLFDSALRAVKSIQQNSESLSLFGNMHLFAYQIHPFFHKASF